MELRENKNNHGELESSCKSTDTIMKAIAGILVIHLGNNAQPLKINGFGHAITHYHTAHKGYEATSEK